MSDCVVLCFVLLCFSLLRMSRPVRSSRKVINYCPPPDSDDESVQKASDADDMEIDEIYVSEDYEANSSSDDDESESSDDEWDEEDEDDEEDDEDMEGDHEYLDQLFEVLQCQQSGFRRLLAGIMVEGDVASTLGTIDDLRLLLVHAGRSHARKKFEVPACFSDTAASMHLRIFVRTQLDALVSSLPYRSAWTRILRQNHQFLDYVASKVPSFMYHLTASYLAPKFPSDVARLVASFADERATEQQLLAMVVYLICAITRGLPDEVKVPLPRSPKKDKDIKSRTVWATEGQSWSNRVCAFGRHCPNCRHVLIRFELPDSKSGKPLRICHRVERIVRSPSDVARIYQEAHDLVSQVHPDVARLIEDPNVLYWHFVGKGNKKIMVTLHPLRRADPSIQAAIEWDGKVKAYLQVQPNPRTAMKKLFLETSLRGTEFYSVEDVYKRLRSALTVKTYQLNHIMASPCPLRVAMFEKKIDLPSLQRYFKQYENARYIKWQRKYRLLELISDGSPESSARAIKLLKRLRQGGTKYCPYLPVFWIRTNGNVRWSDLMDSVGDEVRNFVASNISSFLPKSKSRK
jgi:hypothetical protein